MGLTCCSSPHGGITGWRAPATHMLRLNGWSFLGVLTCLTSPSPTHHLQPLWRFPNQRDGCGEAMLPSWKRVILVGNHRVWGLIILRHFEKKPSGTWTMPLVVLRQIFVLADWLAD